MIYENSFLVFRPMSLHVLLGGGVTVVLTAIGIMVFIYENKKNTGMEDYDYVELDINISYIQEHILVK